jgi:hypothetical protein
MFAEASSTRGTSFSFAIDPDRDHEGVDRAHRGGLGRSEGAGIIFWKGCRSVLWPSCYRSAALSLKSLVNLASFCQNGGGVFSFLKNNPMQSSFSHYLV